MGCCFSADKPPPSQKHPRIPKHSRISKSPPPTNPLPEEETVKEVLSETPAASIPKHTPPAINPRAESPFIKAAPLLHDFSRTELQNGVVYKKPYGADDLSDASEICSTQSESVSASTSLTEKRDQLRELRQRSPARLKNRSHSGEIIREKAVGRSPNRRSEPSPNRVRPAINGSGYGRRRDSGESSGRRSRSPVMRSESWSSKSGLGTRTQSARKTGRSPGRVGSDPGERIRKADGGKESGESKWAAPTSNESLENPLVSLECFIFL